MKILIVEDEGLVAMLLEDMLADEGHEVVGAASTLARAEAFAEQSAFDLAIMDVNLNGERPFAFARRMRARGVKVMFATGYGAGAVDAEFADAPVLTKPFDARALQKALAGVLPG